MRLTKAVLIAAIALLTGCGGGSTARIDPGDLDIRMPIGRLDRDLFRAHPDSMPAASLKAYATYGEFYRIFIEDILQGAPIDDPILPAVLSRFVTDPDWSSVQQAIDSVLGDLGPEQAAFEAAFARLATAFPDRPLPRIVAFNSGFNFGIFPTDSVLGIGLEWFIGSDHPVIGYLAPETFPQFVKDRMRPELLVPGAVKGWLMVNYTPDIRGADVLTNLVEMGKIMALLDALMPDTPAHLKYAFTTQQLRWCEENEFAVWRNIVEGDQLFSRKPADIGRLMNDGPFTNGLPRESPGHIGEWVGHRMVMAYLERNPRTTFAELFALDDPREVLKHYKPR